MQKQMRLQLPSMKLAIKEIFKKIKKITLFTIFYGLVNIVIFHKNLLLMLAYIYCNYLCGNKYFQMSPV